MMDRGSLEKRNRIFSYLWVGAFAVMLVLLMFFTISKPHEQENIKEFFGALSNCFVVPAALLGGIGGLSLMAKLGAYDGLSYAFRNFGIHNLIGGNPKAKRAQSFYEYKQEKEEKGRKWLPQCLYVGLGLLAVSIILSIVYLVI